MSIITLAQATKLLVGVKKRIGRRYIDVYVQTKFAPQEVIRSLTAAGDSIGVVLFDCIADQIEEGVVHFSAKVG